MRILLCLAVLFGLLVAPARAAVVTSVTADADTYVRGGAFSDDAFGGDDFVRAERGIDAGRRFRATVLRFDLDWRAAGVRDAVLNLFRVRSDADQLLTVYGLADGLDSWNEAELTLDAAADRLAADALTALGTIDLTGVPVDSWVTFSSAALTQFLNQAGSDRMVTLVLMSAQTANTNGAFFAAREAGLATAPRLDMVVPVPPAAALLAPFVLLGGVRRLRAQR